MNPSNDKPPKTALIVTISRYCPDCGWSDLHAAKDAELMEHTLLQQGFRKEDILHISDENATKKGILEALENHLLQKAGKGGLAVFHFSGHGQQVRDDNGDEFDGFDEAIVPYDSPLHFQKGTNEGAFLIRDDELGRLLNRVRKKLGKTGHLLTILDACHSGTGTRGMATARGTDVIMADSRYIEEKAGYEGRNENAGLEIAEGPGLAPQVAFFGSGSRELNYEMVNPDGEILGSLTYSFCQALAARKTGETYEALFDRVRLLMGKWAPRQTPQAEGLLQLEVLGGQVLEAEPYFRINPGSFQDAETLSLEAGKLQGLYEGTLLGFYPPGAHNRKDADPIATGRVVQADLLQCLVRLEMPASPDSLLLSRIYVVEQQFGTLQLSVLDQLPEGRIGNAIRQECKRFPFIHFVTEKPELILEQAPDGDSIRVWTRVGEVVLRTGAGLPPEVIAERVVQSLLKYLQAQFLRTLSMEDPALDVRATLLPEKTRKEPKPGSCAIGDVYRLEIANHGELPAYFTILDIQPDHQVNALVPAAGSARSPEEYYLRPGESQYYDILFRIVPPTGLEVLKVIATSEPVDLRAVATTRGQGSDRSHPIEQLFAATFWQQHRGEQALLLIPELNVYTLVFRIEE